MSDRKVHCEIITPEKIVYEGDVEMVIAPGGDGELGILPLHAPLITTLKIGELRLRHDTNKWDYFAVDGGYMEVNEDKVTVLANAAEFSSKMDVVRLRQQKEEIERRLSGLKETDVEFEAASREMEQIANRLRVAERKSITGRS